jgi:hypothetical protein
VIVIYLLNGKKLNPDAALDLPFVNTRVVEVLEDGTPIREDYDDFIQHPPGWLRAASQDELAVHGITVVEEQTRPSDIYHYVDDNGDGTYTSIEKPIEQLRSMFWNVMKAKRDQVISGGFAVGPMTLDSDAESRANIVGAALSAQIAILGNQQWSKAWTLADNSTTMITPSQMIAIGSALDAHVQAAYDRGVEIRQEIAAAQSLADLQSITW